METIRELANRLATMEKEDGSYFDISFGKHRFRFRIVSMINISYLLINGAGIDFRYYGFDEKNELDYLNIAAEFALEIKAKYGIIMATDN